MWRRVPPSFEGSKTPSDEFLKIFYDQDLPRYGDGRPPSTLIGVTRLSKPEFLVEIDLMAVVEPSK